MLKLTNPRKLSDCSPGSDGYFGIKSSMESDNDDMFIRGSPDGMTTPFDHELRTKHESGT